MRICLNSVISAFAVVAVLSLQPTNATGQRARAPEPPIMKNPAPRLPNGKPTFQRVDYGHAEHTYTLDDPKTYTKPWTIKETWTLRPNDRIMEYSCEENNKDFFDGHIAPWRPPSEKD